MGFLPGITNEAVKLVLGTSRAALVEHQVERLKKEDCVFTIHATSAGVHAVANLSCLCDISIVETISHH